MVISGDVGQIDPASIASLKVGSLGLLGSTTQGANGSGTSTITGGIGALTIAGGVSDVTLEAASIGTLKVSGEVNSSTFDVSGQLTSATFSGRVMNSTIAAFTVEKLTMKQGLNAAGGSSMIGGGFPSWRSPISSSMRRFSAR